MEIKLLNKFCSPFFCAWKLFSNPLSPISWLAYSWTGRAWPSVTPPLYCALLRQYARWQVSIRPPWCKTGWLPEASSCKCNPLTALFWPCWTDKKRRRSWLAHCPSRKSNRQRELGGVRRGHAWRCCLLAKQLIGDRILLHGFYA